MSKTGLFQKHTPPRKKHQKPTLAFPHRPCIFKNTLLPTPDNLPVRNCAGIPLAEEFKNLQNKKKTKEQKNKLLKTS